VHATGGTTEPQKFNINEVFDRDPFISVTATQQNGLEH